MRKVVSLSAMAGLLLVACLDDATESAGRMLVDAGEKLADAGAALVDAGNSTADAQADAAAAPVPFVPPAVTPAVTEFVELKCDIQTTRTATFRQTAGSEVLATVTATSYFAETQAADVIGLANGCSLVTQVASQTDPCEIVPVGIPRATCMDAPRPQSETCGHPVPYELSAGKVRVHCGTLQVGTLPNGTELQPSSNLPFTPGARVRSVKLTVVR